MTPATATGAREGAKALLDLADRCKTATHADRELNSDIGALLGEQFNHAYTSSFDAARTLIPSNFRLSLSETPVEDFPRWEVVLIQNDAEFGRGKKITVSANVLELALTEAALRARAAIAKATGAAS